MPTASIPLTSTDESAKNGAAAPRRPRVLMVAHEFYPCSAIGCHRSGKFAKYLPAFGWEPIVLTARRTDETGRFDPSLLEQLPAAMKIVRTFYPDHVELKKSLGAVRSRFNHRSSGNGSTSAAPKETGSALGAAARWLTVPDLPVSWLPWAVQAGLPIARTVDAIYATGPPHAALVIAAVLARISGRRLILDLRDPWLLDKTLSYPTQAHHRLNARLERWCFATAARVICNTSAVTAAYRERYRDWPESKFVTLSNGFDPDDFEGSGAGIVPQLEPGFVHLSYVGNLHGGRDPRPLLRAIRRRRAESNDPLERYRVHFWSATPDRVRDAVRDAGAEEFVDIHPPVPHRDAVAAMKASDVLLVFGASDTDDLHVPGKLFEYVYCRRPTFALVAPGAITELIDGYQLGVWCRPTDEAAIAAGLQRFAQITRDRRPWPISARAFTDFDRRALTRRLADILGGAA